MPSIEVVRGAITAALDRFVAEPLYDLREASPQARLAMEIRTMLDPAEVVLALHEEDPAGRLRQERVLRTSRVQAEMKIGAERIDVIVFRPTDVRMTVYSHVGALDVIAAVRPGDVEVAVEIKAAPSSTQTGTFVQDLKKLARIRHIHRNIETVFVLFDKSLPLAGTTSRANPKFTWLDALGDPGDEEIEAWWVDATGQVAHRRGVVD